jgi:CRP/FNR family transcriptional regulator, cyclic AMP receptor protein
VNSVTSGRLWPSRTLLGSLAPATRDELLVLGTELVFHRGETLMREGERTTFAILLTDGLVRVTARLHSEDDALLAIRIGGDIVGEMASTDDLPRSATVTAAVTVVARRISQHAFLGFLRAHPNAALAINRSVVGKLRWATQRRIDFGRAPVATRVARVLADLARNYGERTPHGWLITQQLTQADIAALVGASTRPVERALRRLRDEGLVRTGYRSLLIIDIVRLAEESGIEVDPFSLGS